MRMGKIDMKINFIVEFQELWIKYEVIDFSKEIEYCDDKNNSYWKIY